MGALQAKLQQTHLDCLHSFFMFKQTWFFYNEIEFPPAHIWFLCSSVHLPKLHPLAAMQIQIMQIFVLKSVSWADAHFSTNSLQKKTNWTDKYHCKNI